MMISVAACNHLKSLAFKASNARRIAVCLGQADILPRRVVLVRFPVLQ
jgi:hypothetical protein